MTNIAGVAYLKELRFPTTRRFQLLMPEQVPSINLAELYSDALAGATIYVNYRDIKLDHGPNGKRKLKMKTTNGIPSEKFFEEFEKIRSNCSLPLYDQIFGVCQSIPLDSLISGICVKDSQEGFGRLSAEATFGMRKGDFKPHLAINDEIVGGRWTAQNRQLIVAPPDELPSEQRHLYKYKDYALDLMLGIMRRTFKDFGEGITGIEFMYDFKRQNMYFVDFYQLISPLRHVSRVQ